MEMCTTAYAYKFHTIMHVYMQFESKLKSKHHLCAQDGQIPHAANIAVR